MTMARKPVKTKQLKAQLSHEISFLKNVFSVMSIPIQMKGENDSNMNYEIVNEKQSNNEEEAPKRARSIAELEEKLNKIKSQNKFNLKNKLVKKSLSSKLNKKLKKKERLNKKNMKPIGDTTPLTAHNTATENVKEEKKLNVNPKPVFNQDGKLVFSKFDFANVGQKGRVNKAEKDPKKILENLKQQEQKFRQLEEKDEGSKAKELKEKVAWKTVLQKAEGQKIKDDPTLLKKSIKKMEQKKKHSQKKWESRIKGVEQKKEERQKKRRENISKKKKEKKSKIVKAAVKRGRVII